MGFTNFYLTNMGSNLLGKTQTGTVLKFTKAQVGSGSVPDGTAMTSVTGLYGREKEIQISSVTTSAKQAQINLQFTNTGVTTAFKWTEIGIFAMDPTEGEILYAYGNAGDAGDPITAESQGPMEFLFTMIVKIDNSTAVTVDINNSLIYATKDDVSVAGIGSLISNATTKTLPIDMDMIPLMDSANTNVLKKLSWANIKGTLKTYFDGLYNKYVHPTGDGYSHVPATSTTSGYKVLTAGTSANAFSWTKPAKKTATLVVGTTASSHTLADCDYLCDGTADEYEINQAINALPTTGGKIIILEGTYNIASNILISARNNMTIQGMGVSTILKRMSYDDNGVINIIGSNYCQIKDFYVNGNIASYMGSIKYGIYMSDGTYNDISNCTIANSYMGIGIISTKYCNISGNKLVGGGTSDTGIYIFGSDTDMAVSTTACNISNNICTGTSSGIFVSSSSGNNVTGNNCYNNTIGILLQNTYASKNIISGNTCLVGSGAYGIRLTNNTANNLVAGNMIFGADVSNTGTNNTLVNNKYN